MNKRKMVRFRFIQNFKNVAVEVKFSSQILKETMTEKIANNWSSEKIKASSICGYDKNSFLINAGVYQAKVEWPDANAMILANVNW